MDSGNEVANFDVKTVSDYPDELSILPKFTNYSFLVFSRSLDLIHLHAPRRLSFRWAIMLMSVGTSQDPFRRRNGKSMMSKQGACVFLQLWSPTQQEAMVWMCVSSPEFMLKPEHQCDSIKSGAFRSWLNPEGGSLVNGISDLMNGLGLKVK